jgi:hypothetical protein
MVRSLPLPSLNSLAQARASDAYQVLADQLALPERLRAEPMESSDENHWQNRVRFARRKLVDAGIVDGSEHGRWQLLSRTHPTVWVEKTLVKGRPDRTAGDHALGRALWSPLRAQNGADIYRNMRFVQPNDIILHLTDNAAFTGTSVAESFARTDFVGVEGTKGAGLTCYRIPLRNFTPLNPPLSREQLLAEPETRQRLLEVRQANSNLFYELNLDFRQGAYITQAPESLVSLLDNVYQAQTGKHLIGTRPVHAVVPNVPTQSRPLGRELQPPKRVWLYAPGRKAVYWNEFREAGIAGMGSDYVGDLSGYDSPEAIKARMDQLSSEPESLVNANQCFDFSHRMASGDWIFVKKGRREIIGFGIVKSDYRFVSERELYRHVRDVAWLKNGSWPTTSHRMLSMKTLTEITDDEELIDELEQLVGLSEPSSIAPSTTAQLPIYTVEDFAAEAEIPQETIELWLSRLKRKQHRVDVSARIP